ncbi:MAG: hypothetical protein GQ564_16105 [Bacteroidales bacterium]|nr:hypothetical protein [Bacteroidales bacterium]
MKALFLNLSILALLITSISCNSVNGKEEKKESETVQSETVQSEKVEAFYFHAIRRCATCEAVEEVAKSYIVENYTDKVSFVSINREEEENAKLVEKYEITGQTLLIVYGDKVVNLTTEAFMNARSNPDKLKELIKSTIDSFLAK